MQNPACVTVQVVSVALIVNVSALKRSCLDYMSFAQGIFIRLAWQHARRQPNRNNLKHFLSLVMLPVHQ